MPVREVNLNRCRPYKDFGKGFYMTAIKKQALQMAMRSTKIYGGSPVVSSFEFNTEEIAHLSVLRFDKPSEKWAIFVMNNRNRRFKDFDNMECNHDNKYDLVIGPIANDDLALLFRQFANGLVDIDVLCRGMEYKELTNQYSFHTEKAITLLHYKDIEHG
jgi:hypothetical protein